MPLPNVIIPGAQKSGTTWLHQALGTSARIHASEPKELNHFNRVDAADPERLAAYAEHFPERPGVTHWLESTPHYFRGPSERLDIARTVHEVLGDVTVLVLLRHPVERYESAYVHHMMQGRLPHETLVDELSDEYGMFTLGLYARHLRHWRQYFPDIAVWLYDDVSRDPEGLVAEVMETLGLPNDVTHDGIHSRTNDKYRKNERLGFDWELIPRLSGDARIELGNRYQEDLRDLQDLLHRDLTEWLERY